MSQACSQHPAFAGLASKNEAGSMGDDVFRQTRFLQCASALAGTMPLSAPKLAAFFDPRLAEDDPLPPERPPAPPTIEFEALYRGHAPRLLHFFSRRTNDSDAADLVQESFARLVRVEQSSQTRIESPAAYLSRIAKNLLRDQKKSAIHRADAMRTEYDDALHAGIDPNPQLNHRDALARVDAAVKRLNRRTREIFLLHRVEGLTYAEIATEMNMSVKGVKKQMAKALFQLRRDVGPI